MSDNDPEVHRDLGRHDAMIAEHDKRLASIETKVDMMLGILQQAKGGWKTLVLVAGISGTMGAFMVKIGTVLHFFKP